ncbi:TPA: phage tail protein [Pseudomonas aeruginosa]|nr:phage tail protein [Pseudomonas aeruginosa]
MGASITLAGESLIAQKQGAQQILTVSRFILANVPGLDPNGPVDRAAGKPAAGQIVGTYDVTDAGYVNPNQVVYSLMMGSDIGDFDWNWIGLETADNVLLMVAYVPTQQKRRNIPPLQLGNNVTRNFLVVFDGAQALTGLTIDASTWQHDFTVRLAGIDERERQSNRDIFGRACFFGSALQLEKVGAVYQLKPGTAYVEGVRLQRSAVLPVVPPALPTTAWLDVALQRELNDVVASWSVVWGAGKVDYVDSAGVQHYCVAIADLPNSNTITDSRPVENIASPLVAHFAARVGDYAGLRARSTTKDDVGLGNLPNAKSDDENTDSSLILATTKAVKAASATIWTAIANIVSGATMVGKASTLNWKKYGAGHVIFDASAGLSPSGTAISDTNPISDWMPNYPTLMGWNGTNTYGVRVARAQKAEALTAPITINGVTANVGSSITIFDSTKLPLAGGILTGGLATKVAGYVVGHVTGDGSLSVMGDQSNSAVMSFHRAGAYAINLGLDTDNVFRLGGWSDGPGVYRFQIDTTGTLLLRGAAVAKNTPTAWVTFNGAGTVTILDSYNVSSITDNGVGNYTINFATPMANTNYMLAGGGLDNDYGDLTVGRPAGGLKNTTAIQIKTLTGTTAIDSSDVGVVFLGGKQ